MHLLAFWNSWCTFHYAVNSFINVNHGIQMNAALFSSRTAIVTVHSVPLNVTVVWTITVAIKFLLATLIRIRLPLYLLSYCIGFNTYVHTAYKRLLNSTCACSEMLMLRWSLQWFSLSCLLVSSCPWFGCIGRCHGQMSITWMCCSFQVHMWWTICISCLLCSSCRLILWCISLLDLLTAVTRWSPLVSSALCHRTCSEIVVGDLVPSPWLFLCFLLGVVVMVVVQMIMVFRYFLQLQLGALNVPIFLVVMKLALVLYLLCAAGFEVLVISSLNDSDDCVFNCEMFGLYLWNLLWLDGDCCKKWD